MTIKTSVRLIWIAVIVSWSALARRTFAHGIRVLYWGMALVVAMSQTTLVLAQGWSGGGGDTGGEDGLECILQNKIEACSPSPISLYQAGQAGSPAGLDIPRTWPGASGVPTLGLDDSGLNAVTRSGISTVGPHAWSSVNGRGRGGSVFLGNGASYVDQVDFRMPLHGLDWFHQRVFSSQSSSSQNWQGEGWWASEMINIDVQGSEGASDVEVEFDPHYTLNFTYSGGSWTCDDNYPYALSFSGGDDEYTVTRVDGMKWIFHDSGGGNKAEKIKRIEDPYGNGWDFNYSGNGTLTDIVAEVIAGSDHKITYDYFSSGDNQGLLQYIKVYKSTTTSDANLIGQIEYVYHDSTIDDYGSEDDLLKVIISVAEKPRSSAANACDACGRS